MKIAVAILITLFFLTEERTPPDGDAWVLKKNKNDIKVFTRQAEGSNMKEFKIIATVVVPISHLVAVLKDVESYPQWMLDVKTTKILKQVSSNEKYYYIEIDAPWPISNRDNIIHFQLQDNPSTKVVTINVAGKPDYLPKKPDVVRIPHSGGTWELRPKENGETEVLSIYSTDPGGSLPAWIINIFVVDRCYKSLINLKEFVEKEKSN